MGEHRQRCDVRDHVATYQLIEQSVVQDIAFVKVKFGRPEIQPGWLSIRRCRKNKGNQANHYFRANSPRTVEPMSPAARSQIRIMNT